MIVCPAISINQVFQEVIGIRINTSIREKTVESSRLVILKKLLLEVTGYRTNGRDLVGIRINTRICNRIGSDQPYWFHKMIIARCQLDWSSKKRSGFSERKLCLVWDVSIQVHAFCTRLPDFTGVSRPSDAMNHGIINKISCSHLVIIEEATVDNDIV